MATVTDAIDVIKELLSVLKPPMAEASIAQTEGQRLRDAAARADRRDEIILRAKKMVREHSYD